MCFVLVTNHRFFHFQNCITNMTVTWGPNTNSCTNPTPYSSGVCKQQLLNWHSCANVPGVQVFVNSSSLAMESNASDILSLINEGRYTLLEKVELYFVFNVIVNSLILSLIHFQIQTGLSLLVANNLPFHLYVSTCFQSVLYTLMIVVEICYYPLKKSVRTSVNTPVKQNGGL